MTTLTNASIPNLSGVTTEENSTLAIVICLKNAHHLLEVFTNAGEGRNSPDGYVSLSNYDIGDNIHITNHIDKDHGHGLSDQRSLINPDQIITWSVETENKLNGFGNPKFGDFTLDAVSFHDSANMLRVLEYAPLKKPGDASFVTHTRGDSYFNCKYCPKILAYNVKVTVKIFSSNGIEGRHTTVRIKFDPMIQTRENP